MCMGKRDAVPFCLATYSADSSLKFRFKDKTNAVAHQDLSWYTRMAGTPLLASKRLAVVI